MHCAFTDPSAYVYVAVIQINQLLKDDAQYPRFKRSLALLPCTEIMYLIKFNAYSRG